MPIGGVTVDERVPMDMEPNVVYPLLVGHRLNNAKILSAFCPTTADISVFGGVNRYTA